MNIVKDDLIVKVDELTGEIEILREELNTANQGRNKLRQKVTDLEDELKQNKTLAKAHGEFTISKCDFDSSIEFISYWFAAHSDQEDEGDVPMAQRKRFTRVEMARVLMERNQVSRAIESLELNLMKLIAFVTSNSTKNVSWNCKRRCDGRK